MVVLGMDTATQVLSVGLGRDGDLLGSAAYLIPRGHSRLLQPSLAAVLKTCGLEVKEVDRVVVGVGPGSYTGVRLGVATAKAMATALGVPLTLVSTLAVMADAVVPASTRQPVLVMPLLYARRQRAFGAIYVKNRDDWRTLVQQQVLPVGEWMAQLERARAMHSSSAAVIHDFIPRYGVTDLLAAPHLDAVTRLQDIAGALGASLIRVGSRSNARTVEGAEIHQVVPDYALQVEAEVKLAERRAGNHGNA